MKQDLTVFSIILAFMGLYLGISLVNADTSNTMLGDAAGYGLLNGGSGTCNTYIGQSAGYWYFSGSSNTFVGCQSGNTSGGGSGNAFLGAHSGVSNSSGSRNVFLGEESGHNNQIGSDNVFVGYKAGYSETGSDMLYVDNCYTGGSCDQPLIKGNFAARTLQIDGSLTMVTVATPSDIRFKKEIYPLQSSLDKVLHLQGVTYEWDQDKVNGAGYKEGKQIGLIAQEVEKVLPELVHTDGKGYKTLSYDKVVPVLVEAIKEQQNTISRLEKTIELMQRRLTSIEDPAKTAALK